LRFAGGKHVDDRQLATAGLFAFDRCARIHRHPLPLSVQDLNLGPQRNDVGVDGAVTAGSQACAGAGLKATAPLVLAGPIAGNADFDFLHVDPLCLRPAIDHEVGRLTGRDS